MARMDKRPAGDLQNIQAIGITLASPEKIVEWSYGEVKKPETINYRTLKPEREGLFCEKIFGPTKDWECHCGKYKKVRYKGITCDRCGVEVTRAKVRRERLGHIALACPVSHIWYFRGIPSRMGLLLDITPKNLERVLYFASYIVLDPGTTPLMKKQLLSDREYRDRQKEFGRYSFRVGMGAEAIEELLKELDINQLSEELRAEFKTATGQKRVRLIKRLEVVESFKKSENKPEWMILKNLPVLPPDLRPMVQLDGGRFATSDLNDLYRRVINRNNRLAKLLSMGAPEIIVRNEKRMLQESVDALIDNGRRGRPVVGAGNRPLKSLSDLLKGKQGRFRQNLLGKRVDYSGRSVIVVGPELKLHQCGLPKEMAIELFKPFIMKRLVQNGHTQNIKTARRMVERATDEIWDILEQVIKDHPVLLNRAPTLHRLGIQAFEPVLVEGRAIKLHPLVCTAYNADFDGDQMAVHVPLSAEAQAEARFLMLSANNLLKPQDGKPVTVPAQDMVLGCYYLTLLKEGAVGEGKCFKDLDEALMAYHENVLSLHAKIKIRVEGDYNGKTISQLVESTLGRFIFNGILPQNLGYVDREKEENAFKLEVDFLVGKKQLGKIIARCIEVEGITNTAQILDKIKAMGYRYSTRSGISIGIFDMIVPDVKQKYVEAAEKKVNFINEQHQKGLLNEKGRKSAVVRVWAQTTEDITKALQGSLDKFNTVHMMADSGARGSMAQIKQLSGMRGNMNDTSGDVIEIPIKSNLREGMNVLEFFISSHGARKALSDTALKTADSGYLTRRLVDVAQDVIVREQDCGSTEVVVMKELAETSKTGNSKRIIKHLADRVAGRYAAEDVVAPNGECLVKKGEIITAIVAEKAEAMGVQEIAIHSVLTCNCKHGVCAKCYGLNLATGEPAVIGEAVGIMAAQSIGEPGTQLTMRTFHSGGIATADDITQGLPRVEELFEARRPKGQAIMCEVSGYVSLADGKHKKEVRVTSKENGEVFVYPISYGIPILVNEGDFIEAGTLLTAGSINLQDIMKVLGAEAVQSYIISEVIKVYNNNGVEINDKHIEIITRQMMRKIKIDDPGDTSLLTGSVIDMFTMREANIKAKEEGHREAEGKRILLGVTKAALATDSFLSAASFQETTRVLTDAAVKGKVDTLIGLKENIIIGTLIPAGTGLSHYRQMSAVPNIVENQPLIRGEVDRVFKFEYDEEFIRRLSEATRPKWKEE